MTASAPRRSHRTPAPPLQYRKLQSPCYALLRSACRGLHVLRAATCRRRSTRSCAGAPRDRTRSATSRLPRGGRRPPASAGVRRRDRRGAAGCRGIPTSLPGTGTGPRSTSRCGLAARCRRAGCSRARQSQRSSRATPSPPCRSSERGGPAGGADRARRAPRGRASREGRRLRPSRGRCPCRAWWQPPAHRAGLRAVFLRAGRAPSRRWKGPLPCRCG